MGYSAAQRYHVPVDVGAATDLIDLNAAAGVMMTWVPAQKCRIYAFGGTYMEAVAAGGMSTTTGVASMGYDKAGSTAEVEKSTITPNVTTGQAIYTEQMGTDFAPFHCDGPAGDAIVFRVKTQAVGGTVTGEIRPFVIVEFFSNLDGVA